MDNSILNSRSPSHCCCCRMMLAKQLLESYHALHMLAFFSLNNMDAVGHRGTYLYPSTQEAETVGLKVWDHSGLIMRSCVNPPPLKKKFGCIYNSSYFYSFGSLNWKQDKKKTILTVSYINLLWVRHQRKRRTWRSSILTQSCMW
jgi:hypothetical protein